jgi:transposase
VREYGRIANTAAGLDRLARKLGRDGVKLRFCYEAGPCGYGIQRQLWAHGHECVVVAPSLIPSAPATGSSPTGGMRPVWRGCIAPAS